MKKTKHLKKSVKIVIVIVCALAIILTAFLVLNNQNKPVEVVSTEIMPFGSWQRPIKKAVIDESKVEFYKEQKEANAEYLGHIYFESGIIDELVMQTTDNEKYLNYDCALNINGEGCVFLDYRNTLEDENMIIYGHYVYYDESKMFSPLHILEDQDEYEDNKYIYLDLENETRKYQVVYVYNYEMNNPNLEYFHTEYDQEYFDKYIESVKKKVFYDSGEELTIDDKMLTLQTCVRGRDDLRLIVVSKQIVD